jgi:hypothetical protein
MTDDELTRLRKFAGWAVNHFCNTESEEAYGVERKAIECGLVEESWVGFVRPLLTPDGEVVDGK